MLDQSYYEVADRIIEKYGKNRHHSFLLCRTFSRVPLSAGRTSYLYRKTDWSNRSKSLQCCNFYENFSFEPKGKYVIKVCDGTACHVRKSMPILEELYKQLGLGKKKHTTEDMMFTVETVSCLGACGLAPTLMVNEDVHPKMSPEKVIELLEELRGEGA